MENTNSIPVEQDAHLSPKRIGRITGSRVGSILGLNPYANRADVLREMVRQYYNAQTGQHYPAEFKGNAATRYGQENEARAIAAFIELMGGEIYGAQDFICHPEHDWLGVSPDGLWGEDSMVEVKCPYRGTYTDWSKHPHYYAQMQLQLHCSDRAHCFFVVMDYNGNISVTICAREDEWLAGVLPALRDFMDEYEETIGDPSKAKPHLEPKLIVRTDATWAAAAEEYRSFAKAAKEMTAAADEAKAKLVELAGAYCVKGAGVTLTRSQRAGSVSYAAAVKALLPGADLAKWTSQPTTVFTATMYDEAKPESAP